MNPIEQTLQAGLSHHRAGRLAEAEGAYRQALAEQPNHPVGLLLLGTLAAETGHLTDAAMLLSKAARLNPRSPDVHAGLGDVLQQLGRVSEAVNAYRNAVTLRPFWPIVHSNLGQALETLRRLTEAEQSIRTALEQQPDLAEAWSNLAEVLRLQGRYDEALSAAKRAIEIKPTFPQPHDIAGNSLHSLGRFEEAIAAHREALRLKPDFAGAWNNLGVALGSAHRLEEAIETFGQALQMDPKNANAYANLGVALMSSGRVDKAVEAIRRAIGLSPDMVMAYSNLGAALREQGLIDEAIGEMRKAVALCPQFAYAHSNVLFALYFHPDVEPAEILREHRAWASMYADPLTMQATPHLRARDPDRRLRLGFVSPDLHGHPVGRFLLPILEHHDRDRFEMICYSNSKRTDDVTTKLTSAADGWLDVLPLSDEAVAERIRADAVDVLIDLSLHSAAHRLMAFARKPAPVQITYLGYAGTTGMRAIDYRLTDLYLDPVGSDEMYSERSIRLPRSYWCFIPPDEAAEVGPPPLRANGYVTFGCLNQFGKMSRLALHAWAEILARTPGSRVTLHAPPGVPRQRVLDLFSRARVDPARIEFIGTQSHREYLATYGRIDLALDPFPYPGGTTTCESLWMGAPVLTLAGRSAVGRAGVSILTNVGLVDFIAGDVQQYVALAVKLASDPDRLAELRATMRWRMKASPLMDAERFARDFESAIRAAWRGEA